MKKKIYSLLLLLSSCLTLFSQEKFEDIYIYINNNNFYGANGQYTTHFILKSNEKPFSHDNYRFQISNIKGKNNNLYSLGNRVHKDSVAFIDPSIYFKDKPACDVHNELSMMSARYEKHLYIVTELNPEVLIKEKNKTNKYMIWEANYIGTNKDVIYTQLGRGPFYTGN